MEILLTRNAEVAAEKKQSARRHVHGDLQAQPGLNVNGDFTSSIWSWLSINEGVYFSNPCILFEIFDGLTW